jgi:hypothetical protein
MTWYADLGPIDYFREDSAPSLRAVGWLGHGHPFPLGPVSPAFFERLGVLLLDPWDPHQFRGFHDCDFCWIEPPSVPSAAWGFTDDELESIRWSGPRRECEPVLVGDRVVSMGRLNLFVPGEGCVYVAPSLIAHYIRTHAYVPPQEFVEAVLRCPEMHSEEYLQARGDLSADEFFQWVWECREPRSKEYREALRAGGAENLANWTPWRWRLRSAD